MADDRFPGWHGTTILAVRRGGKVVVAGHFARAHLPQVAAARATIEALELDVMRMPEGAF